MAAKDCIDAITAALGREPTEKELDDLATAVQTRMKYKMDAGFGLREAARAVGEDMATVAKMEAAKARWVAYNNILKRADLHAVDMPGAEAAAEKAVLSELTTSNARGVATSVNNRAHVLADDLLYPAMAALRKLGLDKLATGRDEAFDLRAAKELKRRDDPTLEAATGDSRAEKVAQILGKVIDGTRAMLNKEGAFIGKIEGYMGRQYHDQWKIAKAGYDEWKSAILKDRDMAHDFPDSDAPAIESRLQAEYRALSTGIHDSSGVSKGGVYSVANKVSQQRSITFKSAEGWWNYNKQFGKGSVMDAVYAAAEKAGRDTALMERFGTTPKAMFDQWHNDNLNRMEAGPAMDKFKANPNGSLFDLVAGFGDTPGNHNYATIGANVRSAMQLLHLGSIMGSAIVHIPLNAIVLRHNDVPFLSAMSGQLRSMFPRTAEGREMASALHAGLDGMKGNIVRRFHTEDGAPGQMARAVNTFYKMNLFGPFMDAQKAGVGLAISHNLAQNSERAYADLAPRLQNSLRRYGIEEAEWDAGRATATQQADGRPYIVPSEMTDERIRDKFQTYLSGQIREGANEPTAWARDKAAFGTAPGTLAGEVSRSLMQFKSFALTMAERQWGRELYRGPNGGRDVPGIFLLAGAMTGFGILGNQLRGLVANERQTDPQDAAGWSSLIVHGMANGGALGLIADAFMRDNIRSGGDVLKAFAGPTVGTAADAIGNIDNTMFGPKTATSHQTRGQMAMQGLHNLGNDIAPNLWFLRAAYNYAIPYSIANLIHPGALQRHEKIMRDNHQTFVLPPGQ